jgi:hypothetical protein
MFEDSTFESGGRIKSKSGRWAMVTGIINASILVLLILIPLIYPEALPKAAMQMALWLRRLLLRRRRRRRRQRARACGPCAVGDDEQSAHGAHPHSA